MFYGNNAGTIPYSSRRQLESKRIGKADDLESLGYALLHLENKSLPWLALSDKKVSISADSDDEVTSYETTETEKSAALAAKRERSATLTEIMVDRDVMWNKMVTKGT